MEGGKPVGSELLVAAHRIPPTRQDHEMSLMQFRLNRMILGPYLTILGTFLGPLGTPMVWFGRVYLASPETINDHLSFIYK